MKTSLQNKLKLALVAVCMLSIGVASAQSTTDVAKTTNAVRVIDNKGTIKYFQSNNGITQIVNATGDVTTTTWQLGGTLTNDTYIDATGKVFAITGVKETSLSAATVADGTGFTLLVRDETTGEVQKMVASDLIQSGQEVFTATNSQTAYLLAGSPALPNFSQVWVYRNGAKLIGTIDYTVSGSTVTLTLADYPVYAGDIIEVQYIK